MRSRGAETGGLSLMEALTIFEYQGFTSQFAAREDGALRCFSCRALVEPESVTLLGLERVEGASDPAEESVVGALQCPSCGARGTATLSYGPHAPVEDGEALRRLEQARHDQVSPPRRPASQDPSLVGDTGWIPHEDRR